MDLREIRRDIDRIDNEIKQLFLQRMEVSGWVAQAKMETGDAILKPEREQQVIERLTGDVPESLRTEYTAFLKKLMMLSRKYQYHATLQATDCYHIPYIQQEPTVMHVCYAGVPGSYGEAAAKALYPEAQLDNRRTFEQVFQAVAEDQNLVGVVPLENSTAGTVDEVYDLLQHYDLSIRRSYVKKVVHCLAGVPGAKLEDITDVYSHPQALAQSSIYLKQHGMTPHEAVNTAIAAQDIVAQGNKSRAAVCSKEAAQRYGLTILAEGINHSQDNGTRFVAVGHGLLARPADDLISLVFTCPHRSGSLAGVLGIFADYGVNLTEIHSRPDGKNPWNYLFYVDFTGNLLEEDIRTMLYQLTEELPYVRILGSCHVHSEL